MLEATESDPAGEDEAIGLVSAHEIKRRLHGPDQRNWMSLWVPTSDQAQAWQLRQPEQSRVDQWHLAAKYAEQREWEETKKRRRQARNA